MLSITDTHLHLWDLTRFRLPWLDDVPQLRHSVTLADYLASASGPGWCIDRALYVETDVTPQQRAAEARYLVNELCTDPQSPVCGGIIAMDLQQPDEVQRWLDSGLMHSNIKGVRHVLHVASQPPGSCLNSVFISNVRQLAKARLCFEACVRTDELRDIAILASHAPQTTLVLNHMGNVDAVRLAKDRGYASRWRENLELLAQNPRMYCKVSGVNIPANSDPGFTHPVIEHALATFDSDKVIFASNFPVCNLTTGLAKWVEIVRDITSSQGIGYQKMLFSTNAARLYQLF